MLSHSAYESALVQGLGWVAFAIVFDGIYGMIWGPFVYPGPPGMPGRIETLTIMECTVGLFRAPLRESPASWITHRGSDVLI